MVLREGQTAYFAAAVNVSVRAALYRALLLRQRTKEKQTHDLPNVS